MSRRVIAVLLSGLACPGAGQIYNRQYVKGGLLAALALGIVGAVFYVTWGGMFDAVSSMPPDSAMEDIFGLSRRVMESNREFFDTATYAFTALWIYGVVDAYIVGRSVKALPHPNPSPGRRGAL